MARTSREFFELPPPGVLAVFERRAVLFIEDEALIRDLVEPVLEEAGFDVHLASRGEEALLLFRKRAAKLCAVVTDVNLGPGLSGWEITKLIRELVADIPVIYATGGNVHEFKAHAVPKSAIFAKPYTPEKVVSAGLALVTKDADPSRPTADAWSMVR